MTDTEREARAALVTAEVQLDALRRYPLRRDLGWSRVQTALLEARVNRLKQTIQVARVLDAS